MKTKKPRGRGRPASRIKYLRRNYSDMILIGLVVVLSVMSGFYFGSASGFNMTQDLQKEERIVQACIAFHIEAAACEEVYGGTPGDGIITDEDAKGLEVR